MQVNQKISKTAHIKELNAEIDRLKAELFATREKNGIYVPADQYEQREESSKLNQVKIEVLEADMEALALKNKLEAEKVAAELALLQQVSKTLYSYQLSITERDEKEKCNITRTEKRQRSLQPLPQAKSVNLLCRWAYRQYLYCVLTSTPWGPDLYGARVINSHFG